MTTYTYLKKGGMWKRPYHLISEDGVTSVCGDVVKGEDGVAMVNYAPQPVDETFVCTACAEKDDNNE